MELKFMDRCPVLPIPIYHFPCPLTDLDNFTSYSGSPEYRSDSLQRFDYQLLHSLSLSYSQRMTESDTNEDIQQALYGFNTDFLSDNGCEDTSLQSDLSNSSSSKQHQTDPQNGAEEVKSNQSFPSQLQLQTHGNRTVQNSSNLIQNSMSHDRNICAVSSALCPTKNEKLGHRQICNAFIEDERTHEQQGHQDKFRDFTTIDENETFIAQNSKLSYFDSSIEKFRNRFNYMRTGDTQFNSSVIETIPIHVIPTNTPIYSKSYCGGSPSKAKLLNILRVKDRSPKASAKNSETFVSKTNDLILLNEENNTQYLSSYCKRELQNNCLIVTESVANESIHVRNIKTEMNFLTEGSLFLNLEHSDDIPRMVQTNESALESSNLTVAVVSQFSSPSAEMNIRGIKNHNSRLLNFNYPNKDKSVSTLLQPFSFRINDFQVFESKVSIFNPDALKRTNCSVMNHKALEKTLQVIPYHNQSILHGSSNSCSSMEFSIRNNSKNYFEFRKVESPNLFNNQRGALRVLSTEHKYKRFPLNPNANKSDFNTEKAGFTPRYMKNKNKKEREMSIETETELFMDKRFEFEDIFELFSDEGDSSCGLIEDDGLSNDSDFECIEDSEYIYSSNLTENSSYTTTKLLQSNLCLTDGDLNTSNEIHIEEKKMAENVLFSDLPIILKYVNDDTLEMEEMLLYPKDYLDNFLKTSEGKQMTRHEILEELIDRSKIYEGKPIGIVSNIRKTRILHTKSKSVGDLSSNFEIVSDDGKIDSDASLKILDSGALSNASATSKGSLNQHERSKCINIDISENFSIYFPRVKNNRLNIPSVVKSVSCKEKVASESCPKCSQSQSSSLCQRQNQSSDDKLRKQNLNRRLPECPSGCPQNKHSTFKNYCGPLNMLYQSKHEISSRRSKRPFSSTPFLTTVQKNSVKHSINRCENYARSPIFCRSTTIAQKVSKVEGKVGHRMESITETNKTPKYNPARLHICATNISSMQKGPYLRSVNIHLNETTMPQTAVKKRVNVEEIVASDFKTFFHFYAKLRGRLKSGSVISKANSNYWFKKTGVIYDNQSAKLAEECFAEVARKKLVLNIYDYIKYLIAVSKRKKLCLLDLVQQLKSVEIVDPVQPKKAANHAISTFNKCTIHNIQATTNHYLPAEKRAEPRTPCTSRASRIPVSSSTVRKFPGKC